MRVRFGGFVGMCFAVVLGLMLVFQLAAQEKKPKVANIQGSVQSIKKDTSTITVKAGEVPRSVMFGGDTKFLYGHSNSNKPGSLDQVKEGFYISCAGEMHGPSLMATECIYRETK